MTRYFSSLDEQIHRDTTTLVAYAIVCGAVILTLLILIFLGEAG